MTFRQDKKGSLKSGDARSFESRDRQEQVGTHIL